MPTSSSAPTRTNSLAIVSLVLSLLAFPAMACYGAGLLFSIAAFITGLVARGQIARSSGLQKGNGLALAGTIIGALPVILGIIGVCLLFALGPQIGQIFSQITSSLNAPSR